MKRILLILLILISKNIIAQDLIVTNNNDSINCQIIEKRGSFLIYKTMVGNTYQLGSIKQEFVSKTETQFYNFHPDLIKKSKETNTQNSKTEFYLTFEVNSSSLVNYGIKSGDEQSKAINAQLAKSTSFSPAFEFWLGNKVGLGLKYEYYKSTASDDNFPVYYGTFPVYFGLFEEVTIHTLSPKLIFRTPVFGNKNYIIFNAMYNYNFYKDLIVLTDKSTTLNYSIEAKSQKSGFGFSAGYEYHPNKNFKIGFITSYYFCEVDNIDLDGNEIELNAANKINLNRFNLGLIVGFH